MKREDIQKQFPEATKEQIDALMAINGDDINKAKGDLAKVQNDLAAAQQQLNESKKPPNGSDTLESQLKALQKKIEAMESANTVRGIRDKVSKDTGVPASLLTGDTEEVCAEQAKAIQDYTKAQQPGYPDLKDGGEPVNGPNQAKTRDSFADAVKDMF